MSALSFHNPLVLFALVAVPLVLVVWVIGTRSAAARARAVSRVAASRPPYLFGALLALSACLAVVAGAQPRWGTERSAIPRTGAELVVIMDISRSMDAKDITPSRLEAAKAAVAATVDRLEGDRVGLVVFAGSARLRFPLTTDVRAARQVVSSLETGAVFVEGGTNASLGLDVALSTFDLTRKAGRAVLIISDGDDLGSDPADAAMRLKSAGIELLVAGAGTSAGASVPVTNPTTGTVTEKKAADGSLIVTRLNEPFLRALAGVAGGRYAGSDLSLLPGIVQARLRALESTVIDERETTIPIERYQWFAGAALAALLLASLAEYLGRRLNARPLAMAGAMLALLLLPGCATRAYEANEEARDALANGDTARAISLFQEASAGRSEDPLAATNLATALHAAGRYDEAILAARRALGSRDADSRARAYASMGHSEFAAGRLVESLDAFRHALIENPHYDASRHDYEVVLSLMRPKTDPDQPPSPGGPPPPGDTGSTPGPGGTPPPNTTPTPGAGQPAQQPGATASPGGGRGDQQVQRDLGAIDAQVRQLLEKSGDNPDAAQALEILKLLAERSRISGLRDASAGNSGPKDY
jgi:Ca-activated chloride channel family protein